MNTHDIHEMNLPFSTSKTFNWKSIVMMIGINLTSLNLMELFIIYIYILYIQMYLQP